MSSTIDKFNSIQPPSSGSLPHPPRQRRRRPRSGRRRRSSHVEPAAASTDGNDSSFGLSDTDAQSSAQLDSSVAGDECGSSGIFSFNHSRIESSCDEIDLESGELEIKVHFLGKNDKQCRICHLNFECNGGDSSLDYDGDGCGDGFIELGCNCKGDLGTAHKQCAETWFKIRGNMTCEICGTIAQNVGKDQTNETSNVNHEIEPVDRSAATPMVVPTETRTLWRGQRIMNILLGCMVLAFIVSWLLHFNVLP